MYCRQEFLSHSSGPAALFITAPSCSFSHWGCDVQAIELQHVQFSRCCRLNKGICMVVTMIWSFWQSNPDREILINLNRIFFCRCRKGAGQMVDQMGRLWPDGHHSPDFSLTAMRVCGEEASAQVPSAEVHKLNLSRKLSSNAASLLVMQLCIHGQRLDGSHQPSRRAQTAAEQAHRICCAVAGVAGMQGQHRQHKGLHLWPVDGAALPGSAILHGTPCWARVPGRCQVSFLTPYTSKTTHSHSERCSIERLPGLGGRRSGQG